MRRVTNAPRTAARAAWVTAALASLFALVASAPLGAAPPRQAAAVRPGVDAYRRSPLSLAVKSGEVTADFVTDHSVFSIVALEGNYDALVNGELNTAPREAVASELLATHADELDFVVVFTSFDISFAEPRVLAHYIGVKNDTAGIGVPLFDDSSFFGSAGKLQGYVDMGQLSSWSTQPTDPEFQRTLAVLVHELFHRWSAFVRVRTGGDPASDALLGSDRAHWGFGTDSDGSVLYGNDWQDAGGGAYASTAALRYLSPLDLYLAGFRAASETPPGVYLDGAEVDRDGAPRQGSTVHGTRHDFTIEDVIAAMGARVPAADAAQHQFRIGFVYLVRPGEQVGDEVTTALEHLREGLMTRFAALTGGRGSVEVYPSVPPGDAPGDPPPVTGGPIRPGDAAIAEALLWLRGRQRADGSWQDRPGTELRDTTTAAVALHELDNTFGGPALARVGDWLRTRNEPTSDSLARLARAAGRLPLGAPVWPSDAPLLAQQNGDGGWGVAAGYRSDPLDTALALLALAPGSTVAARGADHLLASRGADGGWGNYAGAPSRASVTATVLRALRAHGRDATVVDAAVAFLHGKQNADGGFGDSPSTSHDTALALLALMDVGRLGAVDAQAAATYLRHGQSVEGSWDGSVYGTAMAATALQRFAFVDWELLSLTHEPAAPRSGESVVLRARIRNGGNATAPAGAVRFYRQPAGGELVPLGDAAMPALAALEVADVDLRWETAGTTGAQTLIARVNPDHAVVESSESNNEQQLEVTVGPPGNGPDLAIAARDVVVTPPAPAELPADLLIAATVRNLGTTAVDSARVVLRRGGAGGPIVGEATVAVAAQSSAVATFSHLLNEAGRSDFTVQADPDGAVADLDPSNNAAAFAVTTTPAVNLTVAAADVRQLDAAVVGSDVSFAVPIRNGGTSPSPVFQVVYTIRSGDEEVAVLRTDSLVLGAGEQGERTVSWRVDRTGSLTFRVVVDPQEVVAETREYDNQAELPFAATTSSLPNLTIARADLGFAPDPAREGQPLTLTATVHNVGGGTAEGVEVAFFDGDPAHGGTSLGPAQTIATLAAGGAAQATLVVPELAGPDDRLLFVVVDPAGQVAELEEGDNASFLTLPVLSLPDLAIGPASLTLTPRAPVAGEPVTLQVRVANLGEQEVTGVVVRVYDGDLGTGVVVAEQQLASVGAGATATANVTWTYAAGSGARRISVRVDPDGAVAERSRSNNDASLSIVTQSADFYVTDTYLSPNGDGVQEETTVVFHLAPAAVATIEVVDGEGRSRRRFEVTPPATDGVQAWDGRDAAGVVVRDGAYVVRALDAAGAQLGRATVVIDTDRSSLRLAFDTPFLEVKNLTCQVPNADFDEPRTSESEEFLVFSLEPWRSTSPIERTTITGEGRRTIAMLRSGHWPKLSPDGSKVVYDSRVSGPDLHVMNSDGSGAHPLFEDSDWYDFALDGSAVVNLNDEAIDLVPLDGSPSRELFRSPPENGITWYPWTITPSPDRRRLLFREWQGDGEFVVLLDLATGAHRTISGPVGDVLVEDSVQRLFTWAPDGSRFAIVEAGRQRLRVLDAAGNELQTIAVPVPDVTSVAAYAALHLGEVPGPPALEGIEGPAWADDGREIAFRVSYSQDRGVYGAIYRADLTTSEVEVVTWLQPEGYDAQAAAPLGAVQVSVPDDGEGWRMVGTVERQGDRFDFAPFVDAGTERVRLRRLDRAGEVELVVTARGFIPARRGGGGARRWAAVAARRGAAGPVVRSLRARQVENLLASSGPRRQVEKDAVVATTATSSLPPVTSTSAYPTLVWLPFDRALLYEIGGYPYEVGVDISGPLLLPLDGTPSHPVLPGLWGWFPVWEGSALSPSGRRLFFNGLETDPVERARCTTGPYPDEHFYSVRSLLNLTADLTVRYGPGGDSAELSGTAADLDFSHYVLEWARSGEPGTWHPIGLASNQPALDELLTTWFPPGAGSFLLRLSVFDLAGNHASVQRAVSFAVGPSISDVAVAPPLFSPNGDGVLDETTLRYRVLAPVELQIDVVKKNGDVVRSFHRQHADAGNLHEVVWDGRDGLGHYVADGEYRFVVLGARFPVKVDTQPPGGLLQAVAEPVADRDGRMGLRSGVKHCLSERGDLFSGVGDPPASWSHFDLLLSQCVLGPNSELLFSAIDLEELVGRSFRYEAVDDAGNRGAVTARPAGEVLVLTHFGDDGLPLLPVVVPPGQPSQFEPHTTRSRFRFAESVRANLQSLFVRYRELLGDGTTGPWVELPVAAAFSDHHFEAVWDLGNVELPRHVELQFRAVDANGASFFSDRLGMFREVLSFDGFLEELYQIENPSPRTQAILAEILGLAARARLAPDPYGLLVASHNIEGPLASACVYLTSEEDPRYATPQRVCAAAVGQQAMIFDARDLRACTTYHAYLDVWTASTPARAPRELFSPRPPELEALPVPCIALEASWEVEPASQCGEPPPGKVRVLLTPAALAGTPLYQLTLGWLLPNGNAQPVFQQNGPVSGRTLEVEVPVDGPNGSTLLVARLTDVAEGAVEKRLDIRTAQDHAPPHLELTSPPAGQRLCAAAPFVVTGTLDDDIGATVGVSYRMLPGGELKTLPSQPASPTIHFAGTFTSRPNWSNFDAESDVSLRVAASDGGGALECVERVVHVDGAVSTPRVTALPAFISPNGDGRQEAATVQAGAGEATRLTLAVFSGGGTPVRSFLVDAPTIDDVEVSWDGRDDAGNLLPDGRYQVRAAFADDCANSGGAVADVELDNTPPHLVIDLDAVPRPFPLLVEVAGIAADAHLTRWQLEVGGGTDPQTWSVLGRGEASASGVLAAWVTYGLEGTFTLRLTAEDRAGNRNEVRAAVVLDQDFTLLSDFGVEPRLFSPHAGARATTVRFTALRELFVDLTIHDAAGVVVRTLAAQRPYGAGNATIAWDGRRDDGSLAADGTYRVHIAARPSAGSPPVEPNDATVELDGTAPVVALDEPAAQGFVTPAGGVVGSIADPHLTSWSIALATAGAPSSWSELARGSSAPTDPQLASLLGRVDGDHLLRVQAADAAGNAAEIVVPFTIDSQPPVVTLQAPMANAIVGAARGPVTVAGTVEEPALASWRFEAVPTAGGAPIAIASGTAAGEGGAVTAAWNLAGVADGAYTLRLYAVDRAGQSTSTERAVTVDNTPPVAALASPADEALVRGAMAITGQATDAHFDHYELAVTAAPAGPASQWSPISVGTVAVNAGGTLLQWAALPPAGDYALRLQVLDAAGNAATQIVNVHVDQHPPSAPTGLHAQLQGHDVALSWSPNHEPDLDGYAVYRNGVRLNASLVTANAHVDSSPPEGRHRYTVTAFDHAGGESALSAPAEVQVDLTPPQALLFQPAAAARISGLVEIRGMAWSGDDFAEYRVSVGAGDGSAGWQLLARSPQAVRGGTLASWDTTIIATEAAWTIRLEAEDLAGNVGETRIAVTVDNVPPAAPIGLGATIVGGVDVQLAWTANAEPDLAGYLLYRDGRLVNATGPVVGSPAPYLLAGTSYLDAAVPDGDHSYVVYAMDQAGNVSLPSALAAALLDNRAPHADIVAPADGTRFATALHVVAQSPDTDLREVAFQWRPAGQTSWSALSTDTTLPYEATFDAAAFTPALARAEYELQAVATDLADHVDPAPTPITVELTDLTPPAPPSGLALHVDGASVSLQWEAVDAPDLAGYLVFRRDDDGAEVRLTPSPIEALAYVDGGVADGDPVYWVVAVDDAGTESSPSAERTAHVYAPVLAQPFTPVLDATTDLQGTGAAGGTASGDVLMPSGTRPLLSRATDAEGRFTYAGEPLELGANRFTLRVTDAAGDRSRAATVRVIRGTRPPAPTGVNGAVADHEVTISWASGPADVIGHLPSVDGEPLLAEAKVTGLQASASHEAPYCCVAAKVVDGYPGTGWSNPEEGALGEWIEVRSAAPRLVTRVVADVWDSSTFDLQAFDGEAWITLAQLQPPWNGLVDVRLPRPYRTDRIRLLATADVPWLWVAEIEVFEQPVVAGSSYVVTLPDGLHEVTATAWNDLGFEGDPSIVDQVPVGDAEPPLPVTLSGSVAGSTASLEWTASASPDIARYDLYRDGVRVAEHSDLDDRTEQQVLPNGTYRFTVVAVDGNHNRSAPSNEVELAISVDTLAAPHSLTVASAIDGGALLLGWQPGEGSAPAGYRVQRSTTASGPYQDVATTTAASYRDEAVAAGTTYFYVVRAADAAGNLSGPSNEASGTPIDREPPAAPFLSLPTVAGTPWTSLADRADLGGLAQPGTSVSLYRDELWQGSTQALGEPVWSPRRAYGYHASLPTLSPAGRTLAVPYLNGLDLEDVASGGRVRIAVNGSAPRWSADGARLLYARSPALYSYEMATGTESELVRADSLLAGQELPDGRLLVVGRRGTQHALWRFAPTSGTWEIVLALVASSDVDGTTLRVSTSGRYVAYVRLTPAVRTEVVDLTTKAVVFVDAPAGVWAPDWSPTTDALLFAHFESGIGYTSKLWTPADGARQLSLMDGFNHASPQWSPDGRFFVSLHADLRLFVHGLDGAVTSWFPVASGYHLEWSRAGKLAAITPGLWNPGSVRVMAPAGWFELDRVPLVPGTNRFTATATRPPDLASTPSPEIEVLLPDAALPDLAVDALTVLPAAPVLGQPTTLGVRVRNLGPAAAPATEISLAVVGPEGRTDIAERQPVPALAAGEEEQLSWPFAPQLGAGVYVVAVTVDPQQSIAERDESNDTVQRQLRVTAAAGPVLAVTTDAADYDADQQVLGTVQLFNSGPSFDGRLVVKVEDADGFAVETVADASVEALAYGDSRDVPVHWSTAGVFADPYRLHAVLLRSDGSTTAEATATFVLRGQAQIAAAVTSERALYATGSLVHATCDLHYLAGNRAIAGAEVSLRVVDAGDGERMLTTRALGTLLPGSTASVPLDWVTAGTAAGSYDLQCQLREGQTVLATASSLVTLTPGPPTLAGTLTPSTRRPGSGRTFSASWRISQSGGQAVAALPVEIRLTDDTGISLVTRATTVDLPAGGSATGGSTFDTTGLRLGSYLLVLMAVPPGGINAVPLQAVSLYVVDDSPPVVTFELPTEGALVGADGVLVALAHDGESQVRSVAIVLEDGTALSAPLGDAAQGLYRRGIAGLAEGAHLLRARAMDDWENVSETAPRSFVLDTTPPSIEVAGVTEGASYDHPVTVDVEVGDPHPLPEATTITLDGAAFATGTTVTALGPHHLVVWATDAAANAATTTVHFILTAPPPVPRLDADDLSVSESTGVPGAQLTVRLSLPTTVPVGVDFATAPATASDGQDFTPTSGRLVIAAGETTATVTVPILDDATDETDETFTVALANPGGGVLGRSLATVTIADDDGPPLLAAQPLVTTEWSVPRVALLVLDLLPASAKATAFSWQTADGTAHAGIDYEAAQGTVQIPPGTTRVTIPLTILFDPATADEATFEVRFSAPVDLVLAAPSTTVTILRRAVFADGFENGLVPWSQVHGAHQVDGEPAKSAPADVSHVAAPALLAILDASVETRAGEHKNELCLGPSLVRHEDGDEQLGPGVQTIDLSAYARAIDAGQQTFVLETTMRTPAARPADGARVRLELRDAGGALLAAFDSGRRNTGGASSPLREVLVLPVGTRSARLRLIAERSAAPTEGDVAFAGVRLRSARVPAITVGDEVVKVGGDEATARFTVRASCPFEREITLAFATGDESARAGIDYTAAAGVVRLAPPAVERTIDVAVHADPQRQGTKTFRLDLAEVSESGAVLLRPSARATLVAAGCPRSPEVWLELRALWPRELVVGGKARGRRALDELLAYRGQDAVALVARRLVAARLDEVAGDGATLAPAIVAEAEAFVSAHPPGVALTVDDLAAAQRLDRELERAAATACEVER